MATVSNLFIDKGSDSSIVIGLVGSDNLPIDLTDYDVRGSFKHHYESKTSYELPIVLYGDDPTKGLINIIIPNSLSSILMFPRYVYMVEIVNLYSGEIKRVLEGIISVSSSVV